MKRIISIVAFVFCAAVCTFAQTTAFNYQGSLKEGGNPATGAFQMQFKLFDSLGGAGQIGSTITDVPVTVTQGTFSVKLDFGANALSGANRWLEIAVRHNSGESYTTLSPREQIASSPYSVRTLSAASADNALSLGGVAANQYLQANGNGSGLTNLNANNVATGTLNNARLGQLPTANIADSAVTAPKIAGGQVVKSVNTLKDDVTLTAGSNISITPAGNSLTIAATGGANPILNQTTLQAPANFNISGNGIFGGSIGLGTSNLISPLTIQNTSFTYGWTQTNGTVSVSSYVDPQGGWLGTRSNHPLYFFTNGGLQQTALLQNGNFGIGTVLPSERLHINNGGGNAAALVQTPPDAFAQYQMKSGAANTWTIGTQDNFAGGGLLFRNGGNDLLNIQPSGNIAQPRDKGGMVKALIFVNGISGSIVRCYNGVSGSSIPTCGFSVTRLDVGVYQITFPFQVNDRFFSVSTLGFGTAGNDTLIGQTGDFPTATSVRIFISESTTGGRRDGNFCFIVY